MYNINLQGSWKKTLCMKFWNLCRPARAQKAGITIPPPAKKKKDDVNVEPAAPSHSNMAEYGQHINYIKKSYSSQKWSIASMSQLLQETAEERRRWITEDCPSVKDVFAEISLFDRAKACEFMHAACACSCAIYCAENHLPVPSNVHMCLHVYMCMYALTCLFALFIFLDSEGIL